MSGSANIVENGAAGDALADRWANSLGLAPVPLFGDEKVGEASHEILLDGGLGSFAISVTTEELWRDRRAAEWAWSSGVPHHVTVTPDRVAVTRWDAKSPELFSIGSVQQRLEAFYHYLVADRVRSNARVVEELVDLFRRSRSAVASSGIEDAESVNVFLALLAEGIEIAGGKRLPDIDREALKALPQVSRDTLLGEAAGQAKRSELFHLQPELAVRHAGSEIFQEAHFALGQAPTPDLLGWIGPATTRRETRGTAHFTPPALARTIVERALFAAGDVRSRPELTVMDPACGSGSFLYEAVRAIRRMGFNGKLHIIGRDVSAPAVSMARFVLSLASADWAPSGGLQIDLAVADSLRIELPKCDVLLMNPPFLSWNAMPSEQRELTRELLGNLMQGRADLSMVFVIKALATLSAGGVLGALLPASLLTLLAAEKWRGWLTEHADVSMLAFLGDYGLFRHATVQVAGLVLRSGKAEPEAPALALIAGDTAQSTGDAFRAVRRGVTPLDGGEGRWHLYSLAPSTFAAAATWRLVPPAAAEALRRLETLGATRKIGELFDVRQGIRTGWNSLFLVTAAEYANLPARERAWFRPAMTSDNLVDGHLIQGKWLFYPNDGATARIEDEDDLKKAVPQFYARHLAPNRDDLAQRSSITRAGRADWWGLSERRSWSASGAPRILSKYFGAPGSFALDLQGRYAVVQGYAWFPHTDPATLALAGEDEDDGEALRAAAAASIPSQLLPAFAALFNSEPFHAVLRLFSSYVGGGQYDLSPRFVNKVPVPDLVAAARDERGGSMVATLTSLGIHMAPQTPEWRAQVSSVVRSLYGEALFEDL